MAKAKKKPARKLTAAEIAQRKLMLRRLVKTGLVLTALGAGALGLRALEQHVEATTMPDRAPRIVLASRPAWMPDWIAAGIASQIVPGRPSSHLDQQPLIALHDKLARSPWVSQVQQVRRVTPEDGVDTLAIYADFRKPAALVEWGSEYHLVDTNGVVLPLAYPASFVQEVREGRETTMNLRVITGVAQSKPEAGKSWPGQDLRAGIELALLLHDKPFAEDVKVIDVSNHDERLARKAAQIVLMTNEGTRILWGRPVGSEDVISEPRTETKLRHLQHVHDVFGRPGRRYPEWVDIRFDKIEIPYLDQ